MNSNTTMKKPIATDGKDLAWWPPVLPPRKKKSKAAVFALACISTLGRIWRGVRLYLPFFGTWARQERIERQLRLIRDILSNRR